MAVCNNTIQSNLMKVWSLKFEHLMNSSSDNDIRCSTHLLWCAICSAKTSADKLLAVAFKELKGGQVSTRRNLDQFCKAVSYLSLWQGAQKREVQECFHWCMICSQPIFVVAVVDSHFDGH